MNFLYRLLVSISIRQTLNGRNRSKKEPEKGKFNVS